MGTYLIFLPEKSHEQRNLASLSPWSCKELDMAEETEHGTACRFVAG